MRYKLIAIDLDGTLIDHAGRVPDANIEAIERARMAGSIVALCTGRALIECAPVLDRLSRTTTTHDPVIVSGGAMIACRNTDTTLERFTMPLDLVERAAAHLRTHNHAAMVLKDPAATGYDYLIVTPDGPDAIDPASRWWFEHMKVRTRWAARLEDDEHPHDTIRIGAYQANAPLDPLVGSLRETFVPEAAIQHFQGVVLPKDRVDQGVTSVHIVELFHAQADKGQALLRLAARLGIDPAHTAAIGDQSNDLPMIERAGLGIAMGNAIEPITRASKRQTKRAEEAGVAHAIEQMLSGAW